MPLSSQLQQHWQTVVDRLPADFPLSTLSPQAQSVMAFSDFVQQSLVAQPQWLASLKTRPRGAGVASLCRLATGRPGRGQRRSGADA
jgi:glutamate-ammonia-ligase adenylyltransferase